MSNLEFFELVFVQRSLIVGLLMALLSSFLGVLIILRKMSFFSDAISHASLTGIALGVFLGFSPTWGAMAFSLFVGLLIIWFAENKKLQMDSVIGVLFSGSVALGVLLLSRISGYKVNLINFLFGDILAVSQTDLYLSIALFVLVAGMLTYKFKELFFTSFSSDLAHVSGLNVRLWNYLFAAVLSLAVALSIKVVGIVLVSALIIIPATAAKLLCRNVRQMILWSALIGVVSVFVGLISSYHFDVPSGPAIVMVEVVLFSLAWVLK